MTYKEWLTQHFALYEALELSIKKIHPKTYLEIGVCEGHSLRTALKPRMEVVPPDTLFLCDTWGSNSGGSGRGNHEHISQLLADLPYNGTVFFLDGDSAELVPKIPMQLDLILVDGDHSEAHAKLDLENAWKLVRPGGIVIFDDVEHPDHLWLTDIEDDFVWEHDDCFELYWRTDALSGSSALEKTE